MEYQSFRRNRLFCPGPTPVPEMASQAALNTEIYHRSQEFKDILIETRELLAPLFHGHGLPLILTSSGTGAMESAVVNLTDPGDEVLVIDGGKFGERWRKLNETYGCKTHVISVDWGSSPDLDELASTVKSIKNLKAFFIQANETSTGVAYPVGDIVKVVKENSNALTVVDAISALVAQELPMNKLDIDCLLSGSQKGFGVPPGLAFISLSEKAWESLSKGLSFISILPRKLLAKTRVLRPGLRPLP